MVPKQKDEMEKTVNDAFENGSTTRSLLVTIFHTQQSAVFHVDNALLFSVRMYVWSVSLR